jgi:hypothetical protein
LAVAALLGLSVAVGAQEPTEKGRKLLDALTIVECAMGSDRLTEMQRALLDRARSRGLLPPYSEGWCIKQGIVPSALMDGGRES